jgi:hypothetical protein
MKRGIDMNKKIKIEVEIDETTFNGLNNAVAAYGDLCWNLFLGTQVPTKFEILRQFSDEEMKARFESVKALYEIIEKEFDKK